MFRNRLRQLTISALDRLGLLERALEIPWRVRRVRARVCHAATRERRRRSLGRDGVIVGRSSAESTAVVVTRRLYEPEQVVIAERGPELPLATLAMTRASEAHQMLAAEGVDSELTTSEAGVPLLDVGQRDIDEVLAALGRHDPLLYSGSVEPGAQLDATRLSELSNPSGGRGRRIFRYRLTPAGSVQGVETGFDICSSTSPPQSVERSLGEVGAVDVVYTWVDSDDPVWLEQRQLATGGDPQHGSDAASANRFRSIDELRYSLRSVERFAPFVRHVYVVTAGQRPAWMSDTTPGLTVVDHREIMPPDALPTFNSHAIEASLHRIDGLSEHYLYLNDDFVFTGPVSVGSFFLHDGRARCFRSHARIPSTRNDLKTVDMAAVNNRRLVEQRYGVTVAHKFRHAPYPQLRSLVEDIEEEFPDEFAATVRAQFRSATDISVASSLHHHVGLVVGRSVESPIESRYVELSASRLPGRLDRLMYDHAAQTLCINDGADGDLPSIARSTMRAFLDAAFPGAGRYER